MKDDNVKRCEVCGGILPRSRNRYCCAECTRIGMGKASVQMVCRICDAKLYVKTADGLCAPCREMLNDRRTDKEAAKQFEWLMHQKEDKRVKELNEWRMRSQCYRCVYARPLYDNVVFCNSANGTCIKEEQQQRIEEHTIYE